MAFCALVEVGLREAGEYRTAMSGSSQRDSAASINTQRTFVAALARWVRRGRRYGKGVSMARSGWVVELGLCH
jgi:hypothetical protein